MSNGAAHADASAVQAAVTGDFLKSARRRFLNGFIGLAILFVLWWIGGYALSANPETESFSDFGPIPTFKTIPVMWEAGKFRVQLWPAAIDWVWAFLSPLPSVFPWEYLWDAASGFGRSAIHRFSFCEW